MSSFATEVKNELARLNYRRTCCRKAELAGLLRLGSFVTLGAKRALGLSFATDNAAVARKVLVLIKDFEGLMTEVTVSRSRRLKKNNSYQIQIVPTEKVAPFLEELGLLTGFGPTPSKFGKLLRRSCCRWAYLKGAFMSGGSVSRPEAGYHLELVTASYQLAELLIAICKRLDIYAHLTDRKETYIIYIKDFDSVVDFLSGIEADDAVEVFEVTRNVKDVRNQVNRLVNCETANLQKTADAAARQVLSIKLLKEMGELDKLSPKLRQTALSRINNPDASLKELASELEISKSGVSHRLRQLEEIAEKFLENEADKA